MVEGFLVNKKFQRDVSNGMLENYSAEELYTKNYFDVRYGDSFLGPINSNAIYNDKILYKGKIIPIRNNEYNFKLSEGIGVQSSSRVEGFLAYDGHYVTGSAQVLRNQEHLNLTYNANITLRDGEKIIDVFRLTKTNNEIFISSYYKYLGSVTFAVPKQKSSYFLDFFIGFEGYKNLSFFNGKLYNQTFLFIP